MKVMVFDVGGTGIKYSVMDEQLNRTDTGSTPTPADSQEHEETNYCICSFIISTLLFLTNRVFDLPF